MEDPRLPPTSPNACPAPELPDRWDFVLPEGSDPVVVPSDPINLDAAIEHFQLWINTFPESWPTDAERWAEKGALPFVMD